MTAGTEPKYCFPCWELKPRACAYNRKNEPFLVKRAFLMRKHFEKGRRYSFLIVYRMHVSVLSQLVDFFGKFFFKYCLAVGGFFFS